MKSAKPAQADGEVLVPGEPEQRNRAERLARGIPLPDDTWTALLATARELGVNSQPAEVAGIN